MANVVPGWPAVVTSCDDGDTLGGEGGVGNVSAGGTGLDGQPEPDPNPQSLGLGGDGEANGLVCTAADPAVDGSDGEDGARYDTLTFPQ